MPLSISNLSVLASAKKGTLVGVLKLTDMAGVELPASFAIQGPTPFFRIPKSNANLLTNWPPPMPTVPGNYPVVIKASSKVTPYSVTAQFTVSVTGSTTPPLPVPTKIAFNPATVALKDDAAAGTVLTAVSVSTSDGSAFSGTLSSAAPGIIAIVTGNQVVLARALNSGDDGSHLWGINASQNGKTITGSFPATVTPAVVVPPPPPVPTAVTITPSSVTVPDAAVVGAVLSMVSVTMSGGGAFAGALAITPTGTVGASGSALVLTRSLSAADDGPHSFTVTATQNGGSATSNLSLQISGSGTNPVVNLPGSPLPHVPEDSAYIGGAIIPSVHPALVDIQDVQVVTGTVTIRAGWNYNPIQDTPDTTTITMRWMLDDKPLSPYLTAAIEEDPFHEGPFRFYYSWDTTTVPDGTHAIWAQFIDSNTQSYLFQRTQIVAVVVQNHGAIDGAQKVWLGVPEGTAGKTHPGRPDFVTYGGVPNLPNITHPLPTVTQGFIPPLNGDVAGRYGPNWWTDDPAEPRYGGYQFTVWFATTVHGGVVANYINPETDAQVSDSLYFHTSRLRSFDGGRCDATLSPYVTFVPAPDGLSWYAAEFNGRLSQVGFDGSVKAVYGERHNRNVLPYFYLDDSLTEEQVDSRTEFVGDDALEVGGVNNLCFDPRDPDVLYFVNFLHHYIGRVRLSTKTGTVYAGVPGTAGFVNGLASTATFNSPSSIIMSDGTGNAGPIGTMYVADFNNNCIRKITPDGLTVSTFAGKQPVPDNATIAANPTIYDPHTTITGGLANIYLTHPFVIKFTSAGNIVTFRTQFFSVRELDLAAGTSRWVGSYGNYNTPVAEPGSWIWLACDRTGACGPKDDMVLCISVGDFADAGNAAEIIWRLSLDGTLSVGFLGDGSANILPTGTNPVGYSIAPHYPWTFEFAEKQARYIATGFVGNNASMGRYKQPGDPDVSSAHGPGLDVTMYAWGWYLWLTGTVAGRGKGHFPWNSRPSFWSLRGAYGGGHLGCFGDKNTFDDLMAAFPSTMSGDAGDVALANYIRSGMGGSVPRPEITGNDMRDLIYFIRRSSVKGSFPVPYPPGPDDPDTTQPVISAVTATRLSTTSVRFTWMTDKPTIGFVACGSPSQAAFPDNSYCVFSDIEGGFGTAHDVTVTGLPLTTPTHYSVVAKDVPGNCVHTADAIV